MLLEEMRGSLRPVRAREPHFTAFPEFKEASYANRYEILLTKLVREARSTGAGNHHQGIARAWLRAAQHPEPDFLAKDPSRILLLK
jgi:uncharacterized protein YfaQ (DUF2300 family)